MCVGIEIDNLLPDVVLSVSNISITWFRITLSNLNMKAVN